MRKLRIFIFDIVAPGVVSGWIILKYPELLGRVVPWLSFGILWHLTLEVVQSEGLKVKIRGFEVRHKKMIWIVAFVVGGTLSLAYLGAIRLGMATLAKEHDSQLIKQPEIQMSFFNPKYPEWRIINQSSNVLEHVKYWFELVDLDQPYLNSAPNLDGTVTPYAPLRIPVQEISYINPGDTAGALVLPEDLIQNDLLPEI